MLLPEPVGPQTARISPAGTSRSMPAQHRLLARVGEVDVLRSCSPRPPSGSVGRLVRLRQVRDLLQPGERAARRGDRALRQVEDPAQRLERPRQLQQDGVEEDELADRQVAVDHVAAAEEDHGRDRRSWAGRTARAGAGTRRRPGGSRCRAPRLRLAAEARCARRPRGRTPAPSRCPTTASSAASVTSPLRACTCARDRHHQVREAPRDERDQRCRHAGVQRQPRVDRRQHDARRRRSSWRSARPARRPSR